jgi:hypothetical protein
VSSPPLLYWPPCRGLTRCALEKGRIEVSVDVMGAPKVALPVTNTNVVGLSHCRIKLSRVMSGIAHGRRASRGRGGQIGSMPQR